MQSLKTSSSPTVIRLLSRKLNRRGAHSNCAQIAPWGLTKFFHLCQMRMRKNDNIFILDKIIAILLLSPLFCGSDKPTTALEHTKRWLVIG